MKVDTAARVWQVAKQLALGLAALALVTVVCFALRFDSTPTAFLYLIAILLLSSTVSFAVLAALSLLAVACLNSFFHPSNGWTSGTPIDTIELVAFLLTAFVITRVVDRARRSDQGVAERAGLLDLTHDAVCITSMDDRLIYWNRGAEELYGWSADEAIGRMAHELLQTTSHEPIANVAGQLLRTGSWQGELFNVTRAGERIVVAARSVLQRDAEGNPVAHLVVANDITQRKRAEEALRRSEEQWRAVFEHNPTMYFMLDPAGTVLSVNRYGAEQLGYTVEELIGRSVVGVFHEDDGQAAKDHVAACLAHPGEAVSWELRKARKDGTPLWVRETARAMQGTDGGPIVLVACEDITARKRAEDELRASETRFRTLVDHATDGIYLHGEDGVLIDVNRQACDSLGYTRDELIGMSAFDIDPDLDPVAIGKRFEAGEPIVTF
ncbi:MAG TPA: PAS domain S-box protein, partial [Myxococcota bacterium]|nr:PAS domain S-box protein [Myxococcota bacterium]